MKNQTYKLISLTLTNSDVFDEDICIEFDKRGTIIQSPNGGYKSTLVNAMKTGIWPYGGEFNLEAFEGGVDPKYLDLIYVDGESFLGRGDFELYLTEYGVRNSTEFNNLVHQQMKLFDFYPFNQYCQTVNEDPLGYRLNDLAAGEVRILLHVLLICLRKYYGVCGALILDAPFHVLSYPHRNYIYKMLLECCDQVIIFSSQQGLDGLDLDANEVNVISLKPKF